jgi:hypothetical protein
MAVFFILFTIIFLLFIKISVNFCNKNTFFKLNQFIFSKHYVWLIKREPIFTLNLLYLSHIKLPLATKQNYIYIK